METADSRPAARSSTKRGKNKNKHQQSMCHLMLAQIQRAYVHM